MINVKDGRNGIRTRITQIAIGRDPNFTMPPLLQNRERVNALCFSLMIINIYLNLCQDGFSVFNDCWRNNRVIYTRTRGNFE